METSHSGFQKEGQESKYNATVFELLLTLAARVNASLKLSKKLFHHLFNQKHLKLLLQIRLKLKYVSALKDCTGS